MTELLAGRGRQRAILVFVTYLGVAAGTTWPLVRHLTTHLPGHTLDAYVHYWNGWWVRQALSNGQSPFFTSYLFYPRGVSLVYQNLAWVHILGWLGLSPLVGGFASYNLIFLFSLALCGWAAFLLADDLTGDGWGAAFLAGLIYQCWPFRMSQLDHPNLISTFCIPLFLHFLGRTLRRRRWHEGALTGVFFALVGYTRWQLLIPAVIMGSIYLISGVRQVWAARGQWLRPLLLGGAVAALALTPPAALFAGQQRSVPTELLRESDEATLQTDLMAYLTPSSDHPVLGHLTAPAYNRYYSDRSGGRRFAAYVGVTTLVLALVGLAGSPREGARWLVIAGVMISLALGVDLQVNGRIFPAVPMPYRLARGSFVVRLLRFPDRFSLFAALPIAMLAAYGTRKLLRIARFRGTWGNITMISLLAVVITFEYLVVPVSLKHPQFSPIFGTLASEPETLGVLNLPIDAQMCKRYMLDQTVHQQAILQGHVSRLPEGTRAYLDSQPLLKTLRQFGEMDPALTDVSRQLTYLAADDVRYLVMHKQRAESDRLARWRRYLLTSPRLEDEEVVVFSTSPEAGRDFVLMEELGNGIGPVRIVRGSECLNPGQVVEISVGWGTTAPPNRDLDVELSLVSSDGTVAETMVHALSPGWPTHAWPANALAWGYYPLRITASLPPGTYQIRLALVDPETKERQGSLSVVGELKINETPCTVTVPSRAAGSNAIFGDALRLLGYQLRRDGDRLLITLYWRSEQRMETDYKVFVHVFDPATSIPVAQDDAMPRRWRYPTTLWGPGERVEDEIPIDVQDVAPGQYGVAVGVYDPQTMERLLVVDAKGQACPSGRLILPGEIVSIREAGQ